MNRPHEEFCVLDVSKLKMGVNRMISCQLFLCFLGLRQQSFQPHFLLEVRNVQPHVHRIGCEVCTFKAINSIFELLL